VTAVTTPDRGPTTRDAALAIARARLTALKAAAEDRDAAILAALALGMSVVEVARTSGLTRLTVARIRDGRSTGGPGRRPAPAT
jgi:hypothetical protein